MYETACLKLMEAKRVINADIATARADALGVYCDTRDTRADALAVFGNTRDTLAAYSHTIATARDVTTVATARALFKSALNANAPYKAGLEGRQPI
jgi:hypothetical protein